VVVPGYVGARSVKWLDQIDVRAAPSDNYFQATSYRLLPAEADPAAGRQDGFSLGPIAVNCDILSPNDGEWLPAGSTVVRGYALAGDDRGVARVDVSLDGGLSWRQAELDEQVNVWSWRHWRCALDLSPGPVEIIARAWDTAAQAQPESPAPLWNPKGYVNNSWARVRATVAG
jgi:sulfite oxidase